MKFIFPPIYKPTSFYVTFYVEFLGEISHRIYLNYHNAAYVSIGFEWVSLINLEKKFGYTIKKIERKLTDSEVFIC